MKTSWTPEVLEAEAVASLGGGDIVGRWACDSDSTESAKGAKS